MIIALALAIGLSAPPTEFHDYLAGKDDSFTWHIAEQTASKTILEMTSQTWQGIAWHHTLAVLQPRTLEHKGIAVLVITGGKMNRADIAEVQEIADASGMTAAVLFHIPNQPIYGMQEDDLIAHTFEKYIETGDPSWPLLFPMAKSALRAMDVVQAVAKTGPNPIERFVVTGASKRGWTTWFVGASRDPRLAGIVPMVIDNLNIAAQMPHQLRLWGQYSEMIQDYTRRGLQGKLATPAGKRLGQIVDPYSYRADIKAPTLIVNGSNDPYWATDALSLYWDGLKQAKSVVYVANAAHGLGDKKLALADLAAFARSVAGEFRWPSVDWSFEGGVLSAAAKGQTPVGGCVWMANSETMDFRQSRFSPLEKIEPKRGKLKVVLPSEGRNRAFFAEFQFVVHGHPFSLCTRTWVQRVK